MIQIRYRVPANYRPTKRELESWRSRWIAGKSVPVKIEALDWSSPGRSEKEIRAELRKKKTIRTVAGVVERYASACITMCDFDRRVIHPEQRVFKLSRLIRVNPKWIELRRTARGWHMTIEWDCALSPVAQVAIQAILGSDPYREAFNLGRIRGSAINGYMQNDRWNLLFKEKIR
jgi:hypothetical protein